MARSCSLLVGGSYWQGAGARDGSSCCCCCCWQDILYDSGGGGEGDGNDLYLELVSKISSSSRVTI